MLTNYDAIEYYLLNPLVLDNEIDAAAQIAAKLQLGGLCIPPYWVKKASREVTNTSVQLTTIVGYPLGYQRTEAKIAEMELAFADGATAIELVINMSAFKSKRMNWIKAEIARFSNMVHAKEAMLTVIIESAYVDEAELATFCKASVDAGADYIKPATGFLKNTISPEEVNHLVQLLPSSVGLKVVASDASSSAIKELFRAGAQKVVVSSIDFLLEH